MVGQDRAHVVSDLGEAVGVVRLDAGDDYRLRITRPHERPAPVEQHADSIDIDHIMRGLVVGDDGIDDPELRLLRTVESKLRRGGIARNFGRQFPEIHLLSSAP